MDANKVIVLSAGLGGYDEPLEHIKQSVDADYYYYTDKNFPLRDHAITPRLQAKIPKMFGWQMNPGYEYYCWIDGNMVFNHPDTLKYFLEQIQDHDIVVLKHHRRKTIVWEARYLERALNEQSKYAVARYDNEFMKEGLAEIKADKDYVDDIMFIGGLFMYRNTDKVHKATKEWWYHVSRYCVQDQISFPYVLRKAGLKIKVLDHDYTTWEMIKRVNHKKHYA